LGNESVLLYFKKKTEKKSKLRKLKSAIEEFKKKNRGKNGLAGNF
jgi:hypothetical protein